MTVCALRAWHMTSLRWLAFVGTDFEVRPKLTWLFMKSLPSLRISNKSYDFVLVFGRFPAELGPETRSNGSGLKNDAERTQN